MYIRFNHKNCNKLIKMHFHPTKCQRVRRNIIPGNTGSLWSAVKIVKDIPSILTYKYSFNVFDVLWNNKWFEIEIEIVKNIFIQKQKWLKGENHVKQPHTLILFLFHIKKWRADLGMQGPAQQSLKLSLCSNDHTHQLFCYMFVQQLFALYFE